MMIKIIFIDLELELASCWLVTGLLAAKTNDATQHILEERAVCVGGLLCIHVSEECLSIRIFEYAVILILASLLYLFCPTN